MLAYNMPTYRPNMPTAFVLCAAHLTCMMHVWSNGDGWHIKTLACALPCHINPWMCTALLDAAAAGIFNT
jgi:hypothetical protein